MKITWLGQAGLMLEADGKIIMIDPYLSDSCYNLSSTSYRRVSVDEAFLKIKPDIIICTHDHLDHYDEETLNSFLLYTEGVTCLVPPSIFPKIRKYGRGHNYIWFPRHTEWTDGNIRFTSVKAVHSEPEAIGVIIEAEGKKYYITGDTLYNTDIFTDIPEDIFALFMPVNGVGNNMNFADAARFAEKINAKHVVPLHLGMLDDRSITEFSCKGCVTPEIYKEIRL